MEYFDIRCRDDAPPCALGSLCDLVDELIDVLGLTHAHVDGVTDCNEGLPPVASRALADLRAIADQRHVVPAGASRWVVWRMRNGPTVMGVDLDLTERSERDLFVAWAPYSIHAEAMSQVDGEPALVLHDSAENVSAVSTDDVQDEALRQLFTRRRVTFDPAG